MTSQKQLEGTRFTRKGDSNTKVLAPTFTMVAARGQCPYRPTITPINMLCNSLQMLQKKGGVLILTNALQEAPGLSREASCISIT